MESLDYKKRVLLEAFVDLRIAVLVYLIGVILVLIALGAAVSAVISADTSIIAALGLSAAGLALLVLGGLLLLASFLKLYGSAEKFEAADPRLSGLKKRIQLAILAVALVILGGIVDYVSPTIGSAIITLAGILSVIAQILIGLFFMELGNLEREGIPVPSGFRTVGILYLVGIVIGVLQPIALILAYLYSGEAIRRLSTELGENPHSPTTPT